MSNDNKRGTWLIPANVCHFVPATILKAGCKIEILDVSDRDLCLNLSEVVDKIKEGGAYSGLVYVRAFGYENGEPEPYFREIKEFQPEFNIIDDKCLSIPSLSNEMSENVDLELYSTGYSKFIDLSYGGYAKIKEKTSYLKKDLEYNHQDEEGLIDYFQAIIYKNKNVSSSLESVISSNWLETSSIDISVFLETVRGLVEVQKIRKERINMIYDELLPEEIKFSSDHNVWRYTILVKNSLKMLNKLKEEDLFASNHYYPLSKILNLQCKAPVWEALHGNVINLFNDNRYTEDMAERTANIINKNIC